MKSTTIFHLFMNASIYRPDGAAAVPIIITSTTTYGPCGRSTIGCGGDCFQSDNGELRFDKEEPDWVTQFKHISASHPPIRVRSCFGGAALYDFHRLKGLHLDTYDGINPETGNAICEHVPFHDSLKEQIPDFEMYIQPKMLNDGGRSDVTTGFQKLREHEINASLSNPELKHYYDALKT